MQHNFIMKFNFVFWFVLLSIAAISCGGEDVPDGDYEYSTDGDNYLADGDEEQSVIADGDLTENEYDESGDYDLIENTDSEIVFPDGDDDSFPDGDPDFTEIEFAKEIEIVTDGDDEFDDEKETYELDINESETEVEAELEEAPISCGFTYDEDFIYASKTKNNSGLNTFFGKSRQPETIAHIEPAPDGYRIIKHKNKDISDIILPDYADDMPLFSRAEEWDTNTRCYETPDGVKLLTEEQAFDLYVKIVKETLWKDINQSPGFKTVVGLRGTYPGLFEWHGNLSNRFNDTLVLMWVDSSSVKHVREFPVNTDTGYYDFGANSSSSLRPNRHYYYKNGLHRGYSALVIYTQYTSIYYPVRDDSNNNGHWDSDRNGWFPPDTVEDYDRYGNGHNIHMGSKNAPLGTAGVNSWSAGCQVIPGMENWYEFITNAWTNSGDAVDYFLIDARDISLSVWKECPEELGTHACPYKITSLPFEHNGDTRNSNERMLDYYNCSTADERGSEVVYVINIDDTKMQDTGSVVYEDGLTLSVSVEVSDEELYDPDIHLLTGDDQDACRARAHKAFTHEVPPGRYLIVVDTFVNEDNQELPGPYTLKVSAVD